MYIIDKLTYYLMSYYNAIKNNNTLLEEYINNIKKQVANLERERYDFGKNCKLYEKELLDQDERNNHHQNNIDNIITELKSKHKKELLDLEQKNIQLKIDFYDIIRELKNKYEK